MRQSKGKALSGLPGLYPLSQRSNNVPLKKAVSPIDDELLHGAVVIKDLWHGRMGLGVGEQQLQVVATLNPVDAITKAEHARLPVRRAAHPEIRLGEVPKIIIAIKTNHAPLRTAEADRLVEIRFFY